MAIGVSVGDADASLKERHPEPFFAFTQRGFGFLPLGQILHRPDHTPSFTRRVAPNVCAVIDVGPRAISPAKTILAGPTRSTAANRRAKPTYCALTVLGVDAVDPPLPGIRRLGGPAVQRGVGL